MKRSDIGVVLVTFNRIEMLKKSLVCYEAQTVKPAYIIVVDNCSTDGTVEYLKEWEKKDLPFEAEVIYLPENTGGSGGFYAGLEKAQAKPEASWIWVADDDGFPEQDCFEKAEKFIREHDAELPSISAFCGMCVDGGRPAPVQRARFVKKFFMRQELPVPEKEFSSGTPFTIDLYSFVGTILKKSALLEAGLPRKDFFIYQDDYEHAVRMGKVGKIYCVPEIVIEHKDNYTKNRGASWRDYYATRNIVILYKEHLDKLSLYGRIARRLLIAYSSFNRTKIRLIKDAISDGMNGRTGIHKIYKPGWNA